MRFGVAVLPAGSDISGAEAVPGKRSSPSAAPCRGGRAVVAGPAPLVTEPPTEKRMKGLFSTHVLPQGTNGPCSAAHAVLITQTLGIKSLGRCVHDLITACRSFTAQSVSRCSEMSQVL